MVLEIALGVFLGIVLAAFVLKNWRHIQALLSELLALSGWLVVGAIVLGVLAAIGVLVWMNLQTIAMFVGVIATLALLYGVPFWIYRGVTKKYPAFDLLIKGETPWNTSCRLPLRLSVMIVFAVTVAGIGIGALMAGLSIVDYIDALINKK